MKLVSRRRRARHASRLLVGLTGIAITATLALTTQPANADTAHLTGWHTVCADTLTVYNNGPVYVLHRGDAFHIDRFTSGIGHTWGQGFDGVFVPYGWVYNGWFC